MRLTISKIVGASSGQEWSQAYTFSPTDREKLNLRGQFLAVISLTGLANGENKIVMGGREVIARLHEEYYGSLVSSPFEQLKRAVEKVYREGAAEAKIEIGAAVLKENVLYLALIGGGKVVLERDGQLVTLLSSDSSASSVVAASGYLKENDLFLLGTSQLFETISWGLLQAALVSLSPIQAAEMLAPAICGREQEGLMAGLLAIVEKESPVQIETIPTKTPPKKWLISALRTSAEKLKRVIAPVSRKLMQIKPKKSKKTLFTVAFILFLLLGVSVFFGAKQRKFLKTGGEISYLLEQAESKKNEGEAILSLNPAKARELLLEAQQLLKEAETKNPTDKKLVELKLGLEDSLLSILREYKIKPNLFFDLELIKKGAVATDWSLSDGQLVILDGQNLAVYKVDIKSKQAAIVGGGKEFQGGLQIAGDLPGIFVFTGEGIFQVTPKQTLAVKTDSDWGKVIDLQAFGGNLYFLDQKTIWQYPGTEVGLGSKRQWLKQTGGVNLADARGMAVDGSIWVLKATGEILKFTRGSGEAVNFKGLIKSPDSPQALYTDSEQEKLYLLDQNNSRVIVFAKTGEYDSQYYWEGMKAVSGLLVSEKEGKIFLLAGSKIYTLEIKK